MTQHFATQHWASQHWAQQHWAGQRQPGVGNFRNWDTSQGKAGPYPPIVNPLVRVADVEPLRHAAEFRFTPIADAVTQEVRGEVRALVVPEAEMPTADGRPLFETQPVAHETTYQIEPHAGAYAPFTQRLWGIAEGEIHTMVHAAAKPKKKQKTETLVADTGIFEAKGYHNLTDEELVLIATRRRSRRNAGKN